MKTLKVFGMIIIIKWLITAVAVTHFVSHSRSSVMKRTPPSYVALADNTGIHQFYDVYLISSLERKEDLRWLPDDREFLLPAGGNLCHTCGERQSQGSYHDAAAILPQQSFIIIRRKMYPHFVPSQHYKPSAEILNA